ncbi:glycosyltransferase family A protein [Psittacicella hinzii]|uniref:Glycosyltransferase 2-like domain-containing protein n=1 Tax=Psittacicella hinzii TaxID=2028575 RepID=A0A3A1YP75_9GAMM|nr:glycosyltransferase [Psittacicella hinzii]RIY37847.1 hypothetical protein CKF58_04600 [Psittacicella hinzii]
MIFSLIVTCTGKNLAQDLPQFTEALLNQTEDVKASDYEVIFVADNVSEDDYKIIEQQINKFAPQQARLLSQGAAGANAARNLGILNAKGDWLLFFSASDYCEHHFLSELSHAIYAYKGMGVFFTRIQSYQAQGKHHQYADLEGTAPKNIIETDLDDNMIFSLADINNMHRSARRMAFHREFCLEKQILFREDVLFGAEKIFHFSYLYALKKAVNDEDARFAFGYRAVYVKGAVVYTLPPAVRKQQFFVQAGFASQDLIYAQTGYLLAAYELAQQCDFDVNFIVDNFSIIAQSLVYALNFSPSLSVYTEQVRNELIAFVNILKYWMLLIRDLGATVQFLDAVAKDNFFVKVNSLPYALFLQAVACNPAKCNQVIDFLTTKNPHLRTNNFAPLVLPKHKATPAFTKVVKNVASAFMSLFGNKTRKAEVVEDQSAANASLDPNALPQLEAAPSTPNESKYTYSQINNQLVNNASELAYLYYHEVYYQNKEPYLCVVTNVPNRLLALLDQMGFNRKNLTRNISYRICGLTVGRQIMLNLGLLSRAEKKRLFALCAQIHANNSFNYRPTRGLKRTALHFFSNFNLRKHNYIFYRQAEKAQTLEPLQNISKLLGLTSTQASSLPVRLVNAYELGYEVDVAAYELTPELKAAYQVPFRHTEKDTDIAHLELDEIYQKAAALAEKAKYNRQGRDLTNVGKVESMTSMDTAEQELAAEFDKLVAQQQEQGIGVADEEANNPQATSAQNASAQHADTSNATQVKADEVANSASKTAAAQTSQAVNEQEAAAQAENAEAAKSADSAEGASNAQAVKAEAAQITAQTTQTVTVGETEEASVKDAEQADAADDNDGKQVVDAELLDTVDDEELTADDVSPAAQKLSENVDDAAQDLDTDPLVIKLKDIFAPHRIRGLTPSDYPHNYSPVVIEQVGTNANDQSLRSGMNYYTKVVGLNAMIIPLSQVLDRRNFCLSLLAPRFPLQDIIVVVDTLATEYNLAALTVFPNLRLVFTDVRMYNLWLEYVKYYAAGATDLEHEQVDYKLYQHRYDHWRLLTRSFVVVKN